VKRYTLIAAAIAVFIIISFVAVEEAGVPLLTDPSYEIGQGGWLAAAVGGGLLLADILIPVPSSVVMIAHGAAFGLLWGSLLSLMAWTAGSMIGWWIGKKGGRWMDRTVSSAEREKARVFIEKYGLVALVLSRMLPVLAETIVIMSGAMGMSGRKVFLACLLGSIPPAVIYALAGSMATSFSSGLLIAGGVFILAGLAWWISQRMLR